MEPQPGPHGVCEQGCSQHGLQMSLSHHITALRGAEKQDGETGVNSRRHCPGWVEITKL